MKKQVPNYDALVSSEKVTTHRLASSIAILEGNKSEVSIGNIREVLGCLVKIEVECAKRGRPCVEEWLMNSVMKKTK